MERALRQPLRRRPSLERDAAIAVGAQELVSVVRVSAKPAADGFHEALLPTPSSRHHRLASSPHQSEALLSSGLHWIRSRRCAGAVCGGKRSQRGWSVVLRKHDCGEGPIALTTQIFRDDPDTAVVTADGVGGEQASVGVAAGEVIAGLVVCTDVTPIPGGMAIEQCVEQGFRQDGHHGRSGDNTSEGMAHGSEAVGG